VLVLVGSRHDQAARDIVGQWAAHEAALLTCEDLSTPGWRHRPFDPAASQAVVGEQVVPQRDIRGVLVRRPWIMEQELTRIAAPDREYVAAEMNAFLVSWLTSLQCRVLNRPSGTSLCGPNWRPLQWAKAAVGVGIPIAPTEWHIPSTRKRNARKAPDGPAPPIEVILLGERCFGAPDESYVKAVRSLAATADVSLLAVRFDGAEPTPRFLSATAMPSLKDVDVAKAVSDYLLTKTLAR
jgi:hypothetical protein